MPHGFMQYGILYPPNYSRTSGIVWPVLFYGHPNDDGMAGGYPKDVGTLVNQARIDGAFNTIAFRTRYSPIVVVPECDQSIDTSGANPNANFGGYADSPNSGGNEQALTALARLILSTEAADPTRMYWTGDSLGAIGGLASLVDNNRINGINKIWTAAQGLSDQLYRPATPNSQTFSRMTLVPYIAVSTPSDNVPSSYDEPGWQFYTGNSNYPTKAIYDSGGVNSIRAGQSNYYYIRMTGGSPWDSSGGDFRHMNADGGDGTALYDLLFSFIT